MPRRWCTGLAVAAALSVAACTPAAPPPPPANAMALIVPGAHDQRLDDVTQELRDALEARYGPMEISAYKLPLPTAWRSLSVYYQGALSRWDREPALPEAIRAAHGRAWARYGTVFAIALIDTPVPGEERDFKVLVVATNRP